MAKKKTKEKKKNLLERVAYLELKIDKEFFDKILNSFENFVTGLNLIKERMDQIDGKLEKMVQKISQIEIKIFK